MTRSPIELFWTAKKHIRRKVAWLLINVLAGVSYFILLTMYSNQAINGTELLGASLRVRISCTGVYFIILTFQTSYCDDFNHQMFCYFELYKEFLSSQCTSYVFWTFWFLPPVVLPRGTYLPPSPQTPHQHGTSHHMEKVWCTQDKLSLTLSLPSYGNPKVWRTDLRTDIWHGSTYRC